MEGFWEGGQMLKNVERGELWKGPKCGKGREIRES